MAQGRRTPTRIKELQGTREKSREPKNEMTPPTIAASDLETPNGLVNDYAVNEWNKQTRVLNELGMLHETDLSLLLAYCNESGIYFQAMDDIKESGFYAYSKQNGKIVDASYSAANRALANMIKIADKFGFNPASRSKIEAPIKGNDDPFDDL